MRFFRWTTSIFILSSIQGCVGLQITHPATHKLDDLSGDVEYFDSKNKKGECSLVYAAEGDKTYKCSLERYWGFLYVGVGVVLPIPYYRYTLYRTFVFNDGEIEESYIDMWAYSCAFCGFYGHHESIDLGCKMGASLTD